MSISDSSVNQTLQFFFPNYKCCVCGAASDDVGLCESCRQKIKEQASCDNCPIFILPGQTLCEECLSGRTLPFKKAVAAFPYEGTLRENILNYKYNDQVELARPFAMVFKYLLAARLADEQIDLLVPMPISHNRLKERGYDHMAMCARILSREIKVPVAYKAVFHVKETQKLHTLNRDQRFAEVADAFAARADEVKGKSILLLDDIFTTGATSAACGGELLKAGAKQVLFASLASVALD